MSKYNFDASFNRKQSCSIRWNVNEGELPLDIADMDFMVMPEIEKAVKARAEQACYGYTFVPDSYYQAYIRWWRDRHSTILEKDWFIFSKSVVASIDSIFKHLGKPKDEVVMFTPVYNVFFNCIKNNNLVLKECEFILNKELSIDWKKLETQLHGASFFLLCNPHNPLGRKFTIEELNKIINLCKQNNVYVISDEIHGDIDLNKGRYISILNSGVSRYDKVITLLSPSKVFNVAGLHSSVAVISNNELKEMVQNGFWQDDIGEPNYFAVDPVITAFTYGDEYVDQLNSYLNENRAFLMEFLLKNLPNLKIISGTYTYLVWIDISCYSKDSRLFVKRLKESTGLIVAPGINYGKSGEGYIRLNIATPRNNLIDACNRLMKYISVNEEE